MFQKFNTKASLKIFFYIAIKIIYQHILPIKFFPYYFIIAYKKNKVTEKFIFYILDKE